MKTTIMDPIDTAGEADLQRKSPWKSVPRTSYGVYSYTHPGNGSLEKDTGKQISAS